MNLVDSSQAGAHAGRGIGRLRHGLQPYLCIVERIFQLTSNPLQRYITLCSAHPNNLSIQVT